MSWSLADLPDQTDRTFVVTGSTSGVGRFGALELARRGAQVVLAARNEAKLATTAAEIRAAVPGAHLEQLVIDLSDLESVRRAATEAATFGPIDVLINNAGIMATPYRCTADGLEAQLATNHFGPFLFTGLLMPQLVASGAGRVVTQASSAHRSARKSPLQDPYDHTGYRRWAAYAQSKLANLQFTFELDRRARLAGLPVMAMAAHPGLSATNLMPASAIPGLSAIFDAAMRAAGQPPSLGALPMLMAATDNLPGGTYCGPDGLAERRGLAQIVTATPLANNREDQAALWELSESVVGLEYPA